jgi:hypothetical protein
MESQIIRYHCGRIWYDTLTRVARAMVLVLVKGECERTLVENVRKLVYET